jgi:hypothetical protein
MTTYEDCSNPLRVVVVVVMGMMVVVVMGMVVVAVIMAKTSINTKS